MSNELIDAPDGSDVLVLSGLGTVVYGEYVDPFSDYAEAAYYAVITSCLKVTLNGEDITDSVKWSDKHDRFLLKKFKDLTYENIDFGVSNEAHDLPQSVFFLSAGADPKLIELLPIKGDFKDLKEGTVADFVVYDGEVVEAESLENWDGNLDISFDDEEYSNNSEIYNEWKDEYDDDYIQTSIG